jgi:hypothetical protein
MALRPPSILRTQLLAKVLVARNMAASAISSGSAGRPKGVCSTKPCFMRGGRSADDCTLAFAFSWKDTHATGTATRYAQYSAGEKILESLHIPCHMGLLTQPGKSALIRMPRTRCSSHWARVKAEHEQVTLALCAFCSHVHYYGDTRTNSPTYQ